MRHWVFSPHQGLCTDRSPRMRPSDRCAVRFSVIRDCDGKENDEALVALKLQCTRAIWLVNCGS